MFSRNTTSLQQPFAAGNRIPVAIAGAGQLSDARLALTASSDRYRSGRRSSPAFRSLIGAETGP
jgi:hypothetical protein